MSAVIESPEGYRAALYIRLSREDEQEGPSESVNNQRALLLGFAQENGLTVHDVYVDDGWSGTDFDRPAFRRMIADIENGAVNMVLTKDLSRLGRDYILTGHYLERYFPEKRVRYLSLLDGVDTGVESSANEITPFRAILNDLYAKDISRKIKSVKRDKQRRGQFIGGKPVYGYRMHPTEKNRIVVDERAAAVVRRVFALALTGVSCRAIAAQLNAEGVPTPARYAGLTVARPGPYTGLWSGERISEMLRNETYLGHMVQGRTVKPSYKSKKCLRQPSERWVVVKNTHDPLVDEDTFARVTRLLASRRATRSRKHEFLLRGVIFCRECGAPLAAVNRRTAAGEERLYLMCRTYQRAPGAGVCSCHSIREKTVTDAVWAQVRAALAPLFSEAALLPIAREAAARTARADEAQRETRTARAALGALNDRLDRMYLDRLDGVLDEADFSRIHQKLTAERAALTARLAQLERPPETPDARAEALTRRFLETLPQNRDLLVSLVSRVEFSADRAVHLHFRFTPPSVALPAPGGIAHRDKSAGEAADGA